MMDHTSLDFSQKVIAGMMLGRRRAMEEYLRWNQSMVVGDKNGNIIEVTPDQIRVRLANFPADPFAYVAAQSN